MRHGPVILLLLLMQTEIGADAGDVSQRGRTVAHLSRSQHRVGDRRRPVLRPLPLVPYGWQVCASWFVLVCLHFRLCTVFMTQTVSVRV